MLPILANHGCSLIGLHVFENEALVIPICCLKLLMDNNVADVAGFFAVFGGIEAGPGIQVKQNEQRGEL
ncbi:MAG TPA: hypothetical protein VFC07_01960 [Verrucomicrobiae bacterium]|nr:hypothetical protein [Verrucomicrobiae bacterium]